MILKSEADTAAAGAALARLARPGDVITGTVQVTASAPGYTAGSATVNVGERALTVENAESVRACVAADGARVVRRVVEMSEAGRAPSNDPALFVLAMCAGIGAEATRAAALAALPAVARTGTHLFHWLQYLGAFRGWGRGARRAVARWYTAKPAPALAYQMLKYPSRDGWGISFCPGWT